MWEKRQVKLEKSPERVYYATEERRDDLAGVTDAEMMFLFGKLRGDVEYFYERYPLTARDLA